MVKEGIDPNQQKQDEMMEKVGMKTFEEVARQWYEKGNWVERYKKRILSSLENDAFPIIGCRPIQETTRADINEVAKQIGGAFTHKSVEQRIEKVSGYQPINLPQDYKVID